jgi:hypothetical protein
VTSRVLSLPCMLVGKRVTQKLVTRRKPPVSYCDGPTYSQQLSNISWTFRGSCSQLQRASLLPLLQPTIS